MKITLKPLGPRNPFVVLAHKRKAGAHIKSNKAERRSDKTKLKRELSSARLEHPVFTRRVENSIFSAPTKTF